MYFFYSIEESRFPETGLYEEPGRPFNFIKVRVYCYSRTRRYFDFPHEIWSCYKCGQPAMASYSEPGSKCFINGCKESFGYLWVKNRWKYVRV